MKTDIVIPTFNQENFTVKCLESIRKHTPKDDYRIVWVDNGSSEESRKTVLAEIIRHDYVSIWLEKNLGFVKATNIGISAGDSEYLVLQNNDTEVTPGWMDRLKKPLSTGYSASGPMTNTSGSWQGWQNVKNNMFKDIPDLSRMSIDSASGVLKERYDDVIRRVSMVAFFCTMFDRGVFNELGMLDEVFKSGLGDDDDFCARMTKVGRKIAFVPSSYVLHHHRTTFKSVFGEEEVRRMQEENMIVFKRKHKLT